MKNALWGQLAVALTTVLAAPAFADQALATAKNCMTCHTLEKKLVGPSFKEIASKYSGQSVSDALAGKIMKGGSGVFGPVPMPANTQVNDAEARKLAVWVLSIK